METISKKNIHLTLLIIGENIDKSFIEKLYKKKKFKEKKINKPNYKYIEVINSISWKIDYFENGLENNIFQQIQAKIDSDRKEDFYFHVLICFTNSENKIKEFLQFISSKNIYYQPFIIFISNSSFDTKSLRHYLRQDENNFIDPRNIEIIKYIEGNEIILLDSIWRKCCNYNQLGNSLILPSMNNNKVNIVKKDHALNFFIIGKTGVGKSTFVNILAGDIVSPERVGKNITKGTKEYICKNISMYIYDTEGFSSGDEIVTVEKDIFATMDKLIEKKQIINGIFYMFNITSPRTYDIKEESLIKKIFQKNIKIYFLLNHSNPKNINTKRMKQVYLEESEKRLSKEDFAKFKDNLFLVNLKKEETSCLGLDILFEKLYNEYKDSKVNIDDLKNCDLSKNNIKKIVGDSIFFKNLYSKSDILDYICNICDKEVYVFSTAAGIVGLTDIIPFADLPIITGIQITMIIFIASTFGIEINKSKASELLKSFFASSLTGSILVGAGYGLSQLIKVSFPALGIVISNIINGSIGAGATLGIGKIAIKYFTNLFGEKEALYFLIERAKIINETINKLNDYSNDFKNYDDYSEIADKYL
jgi:uncharacterized protein (DUF697 family)